MKTVTESFVLPCTPEAYWRQFLDENYTRALFMEVLEFKSFAVLELTDSSRKLRVSPKINLPGVLQKLIGDSFAYEEHGTLDRAKGEWTWRMVQPAGVGGKPKVATHGTIRVEALPDGKCRRTDKLIAEANVFGVGGLIESTVEKEVRASWAKELPFFEKWLTKK